MVRQINIARDRYTVGIWYLQAESENGRPIQGAENEPADTDSIGEIGVLSVLL